MPWHKCERRKSKARIETAYYETPLELELIANESSHNCII